MENILVILLIIIVIGIGVLIYLFLNKDKKPAQDAGSLSLLLEQMNNLTRTVDAKIGEGTKQMHEAVRNQFGDSQKLIREITKEITEVKEVGRQTATFADQLKSLQAW